MPSRYLSRKYPSRSKAGRFEEFAEEAFKQILQQLMENFHTLKVKNSTYPGNYACFRKIIMEKAKIIR